MTDLSERCNMILFNGNIMTMNSQNEIVQAVAILNTKILKIGSNAEVRSLATRETELIDLKGRTMLPGFIDAHTQIATAAINLAHTIHVHTPPMKSIREILDKIREGTRARRKGDVIICQGSFQLEEKVIEKRYPTKAELDEVAPEHPVLIRASAHVFLLNSRALKLANISKDTPDPKGAHIVKDSLGEPTGVLQEFSSHLSLKSYTVNEIKNAVKRIAYEYYVKKGVTSVYDFPYSTEAIGAYQELRSERQLPLRIRMSIIVPGIIDLNSFLKLGLKSGFGDEKLKLGGIKLYADGDADTAAVHKHFAGPPDYYGLLVYTQNELNELVKKVHKAEMQVLIHAVGDRAQDMALDAIEKAVKELPRKDHRHRIEHLGDFFCTRERIKRVKDLGIIAVVTPAFPYFSGDYYQSRIGQANSYLYGALRSMFDQNLMPPGSSDCSGSIPESTNPFFNIWCAITHEMQEGGILCPDEKISILEGLKMYTVNSAHAGFEENIKGTIEPGKLADLIVLSEDPLKIPDSEIKNIEVTKTIIGGRLVHGG